MVPTYVAKPMPNNCLKYFFFEFQYETDISSQIMFLICLFTKQHRFEVRIKTPTTHFPSRASGLPSSSRPAVTPYTTLILIMLILLISL